MAYTGRHRRPVRDQFYMFCGPDGWIWSEIFLADGLHMVAPTPFRGMEDAERVTGERNPEAYVDVLCDEREIDQAIKWAIDRPLEPLPV
jgi:hypothetical protein